MLASHVNDAAMYWLLLVLAMGIATLGLALGSSAVVLGAMLISPLMAPIVGLGMGLAVGSPVLVARSFARGAVSIAVVVAGATAITLALPFHEVTAPIAARTAPTALDLLVSICCALVASFATVAARTQATTTAAGTAVAIALVPPLCVVGFGLGTQQLGLARGAALLFVASFSAITLFAVLTFTVFGFGELDPTALEKATLAHDEPQSIAIDRVRRWLGGRSGGVLRIVLPLLLLALVYVPLHRAPSKRSPGKSALGRRSPASSTALPNPACGLRSRCRSIESISPWSSSARRPQRRIWSEASSSVSRQPRGWCRRSGCSPFPTYRRCTRPWRPAPVPKPAVVAVPDLRESTMRLAEAIARSWPTEAVGPLITWRLDVTSGGSALVDMVHFGTALGPAAEQMLARDLSDAAGESVGIRDVVLPSEPMMATLDGGDGWLTKLAPVLDEVSRDDGLFACVGVPSPVAPKRDPQRGVGRGGPCGGRTRTGHPRHGMDTARAKRTVPRAGRDRCRRPD